MASTPSPAPASGPPVAARRRRVIAGYVVAAGTWIVVTDLVSFSVGAGTAMEQTFKGAAFVAVTAGVLAVLLRRHDRALHAEHRIRLARDHQLDLIAAVTQDVIYRIELDPRRFTFVSPSVYPLLGVTPQEVLADASIAEWFVHPEDLALRDATTGDELVRLRWRHRNGRTVWTEQRNRVERQGDVATAIVGVARDVTEEVLTTSVHAACSRLDRVVLDGGSAHDGLRGLVDDVLAVMEASRLRVSIDMAWGGAFDVEVSRSESVPDAVPLVVTRGRASIELTPSPQTPSTPLVRALLEECLGRIETSVDHDRRRGELERVEVALRATGIAIVLTDDQARITWTNEAFARLTGLSTRFSSNQTPARGIATVLGRAGTEVTAHLVARIAAGLPVDTELQMTRADGTSFLAAFTAAPVRTPGGRLEGAVASLRDITEERRASDELHAAQLSVLRRQRDLERERTALVQTLSHELRTPLTVVLGAAQTLQRDRLSADVQAGLVRSLERGTDDLVRHLDAVLAATDGLSGEVVATTGRAVIGMAMERLASRHDLGRVHIDGDAAWTGPATDAASLLRPLIHNALKFSDEDTTVEVDIRPLPAGSGAVAIDVTDHGPGIPEAMIPLLDRPFRQADSTTTRPHNGLGLGLHAARRAADRLGARLVTTTCPAGTRVRVELPVGAAAAEQLALDHTRPVVGASTHAGQRAGSSASARSRT